MNSTPGNNEFKINTTPEKPIHRASTNIVFSVAILFIFILSCVSVYQFYNLMTANRWVVHTYEVIAATQDSLYQLTGLENKQQLYVDEKSSKAEFDKQISIIMSNLSALKNLTVDNPVQYAKIGELKNLVDSKIAVMQKILTEKARAPVDADNLDILMKKSLALSQEIYTLANNVITVESSLLRIRNTAFVQNASMTNIFFNSGRVISLAFLLLAFWLFNRAIKKHQEAETKIRTMELQLRSIIEGARDMIAALDPEYRFVIFNEPYAREFHRLFAVKISLGMSLGEALANFPDVLNSFKRIWDKAFEGIEEMQNVQINVNGQTIFYEISTSLIKSASNEILGAVQIKRNVTERTINEHLLNSGMLELRDKNEKITLLLEMSDVMLACDSIEELSQITAKYCNRVLSFSQGVFYIMHPSKDFLESSAIWGDPASSTNHFTQDECWAVRLGHIHRAGCGKSDLTCNHVMKSGKADICYLCVPLRAQNDIYGLLYVEIVKHDGIQELNENEKLLVNAFAELAALALANVRLRENLSYQSIRDPLTALYNRRYLEEFLSKLIHQSERDKKPVAILMLDMDHFKRINDIHGHDAGDLILKQFSQLLIQQIRAGDIAARYGGEEFIVVMYNTDAKQAMQRAEEIRKLVSLLHVKFGAQETGEITVSIGISMFPNDGTDGPALIELADKALYTAKNTGRNKCVMFADIQAKQPAQLPEDIEETV